MPPQVRVFYAYPSYPPSVGETISSAVSKLNEIRDIKQNSVRFTKWTDNGVSGSHLIKTVLGQVDRSHIFSCDLTYPNPNVNFELGYAIARFKRIFTTLNPSIVDADKDYKRIYFSSLNMGYAEYDNHENLADRFLSERPWQSLDQTLLDRRYRQQVTRPENPTVMYLKPPSNTDSVLATTEVLTKSIFADSIIIDDPNEYSSQMLDWYAEKLQIADAIVVHLLSTDHADHRDHNLKASIVAGLAQGFGRPMIMLAHAPYESPVDYDQWLKVHDTAESCVTITRTWLESVSDSLSHRRPRRQKVVRNTSARIDLRSLFLGDPVAEHEADRLFEYFVETSSYFQALKGPLTILVGRRGTGKTAILYAIRSEMSKNRDDHVTVIKPIGYETHGLIRVLDDIRHRSERGFLIESLWKYLIYSEIATSVTAELFSRPNYHGRTPEETAFLDYYERYSRVLSPPFSVRELLDILSIHGVEEASNVPKATDPLCQRAEAGALAIVAVPDPEEEVRSVVRSIAASEASFHRMAVIHRQDNPYASLLRQELDFAHIPYSGVTHRSLGDTQTGLLLLGLVDLAVELNGPQGAIDRERFIEWITSTPVRWPRGQGEDEPFPPSITVPATAWANLARSAKANGAVQNWNSRLAAYLAQMEPQAEADNGRDNDDDPFMRRLRRSVAQLQEFLDRLAGALGSFGNSNGMEWESASTRLKSLMTTYRWAVAEELPDDLLRIDELVDSLVSLKEWGTGFSPEALRESIREGLQSQASDRGEPVGAGVYIGPPAGIAGTEYDVMYAVGMVERQFPPRPRANPWLAQNRPELDRVSSLERYDFMAAVAAARKVVLSWPAATAERRSSYPSRWIIEAANHLHEREGGTNRLTHENLTENASAKPWLTVVPSREAGLRYLSDFHMQPADGTEYNLMHLLAETRDTLLHHQAIASDSRMSNALKARNARNGNVLSPWDGRLELDIPRVAAIGTRDYPISPSALETWATCPYKFFLNRILDIAAPPEEEEDEISASERGSLVHKILERFVREGNQTDTDLLELAESEFAIAEERGVTGYPLLWDIAKEDIRAGLQRFIAAETEWLADTAAEASAEDSFGRGTEIGEVSVAIDDLGEIWFRGKIDRIDTVGDEVRVRDFKTGKPELYSDGARGRKADRTLANGRAMQLPVYVAAARKKYPDPAVQISGSYCFPLADNNTHGVAPYSEDDWKEFHTPLFAIVDAARRGVFPATPETAGDSDQERGNCTYCDFNRLCPTRRRQVWERKAREDAETVGPFNSLGGKAAISADDNDN